MHEETRYLLGLVGATILVCGGLILKAPAQQFICNEFEEACVIEPEVCEGLECEEVPVVTKSNGSAEVWPNIGRCVFNDMSERWQCLPSHPVFPNPESFIYRDCLQDSGETPERCLRQWSERENFEFCGPTAPGTGSPYVPGSGRIEVPYQNGAARELNQYEAAFQCANQIIAPPQRGSGRSPYRLRRR